MNSPTGSTRLAGVLGHPVRYSLSPALHNAAYEVLGIDTVYLAIPVKPEDVETAVRSVLALDMLGVSVTIPLKEAVIPHLDELSRSAERLGAVNCIAVADDRLIGHNTDGAGFVASLRERGFDPMHKRATLIGAGGSAKAVTVALLDAGISQVTVVNRNRERAEQLVEFSEKIEIGTTSSIADSHLIVNATPIGMSASHPDQIPFDPGFIQPEHTVADLVYVPLDTPLLEAAAERGATPVHGTGMLLHQAAEQIRLWTGLEPPLDAMRAALEQP